MSDPVSPDPVFPDTDPEVAARRRLHLQRHRRRRRLREWRQRIAFWVGAVLVGLAGLAFAWLSDHSFGLFQQLLQHSAFWPWLVTPLGFALLAWLTQGVLREARGSGIPQVIASIQREEPDLRARLLGAPVALGKMLLTAGALLVGGSIGREGPTVHVGAALLYGFGKRLGLHGRRTLSGLILAGGAAGIAAAFNTPLGGVVFAIEELTHMFEQRFSGLVLTAVLLGGIVTLGIMGPYSYLGDLNLGLTWGIGWLAVPVAGLLGGLLGGFYGRLILPTEKGWLGRMNALRRRRPVAFAAGCGLALAALGLCSGQHVFGTGYAETHAILSGEPVTGEGFLLWKFLANVVSYLAGIPGGLFSPALAVGAALGPWMADWLPGVSLAQCALLGLAAYLAGVTRTPLTATVITLEMVGSPDMTLPVLAVCLLSSAVSGWLMPVPLYHALSKQVLDALTPKRD
ncbi:chloride channel protein [Pseudomonas oryzihabitans]|nr:chloride channel protein [Pseudomonas psychrotolerans]KTT35887.1 chloride channel protein [Pseudomonas psychrotolerans]KTT46320.1 chloride channel protein [Pseudomonas psychrotolerans]KTT48961.1 chloride channel protein [Pseudomonas psychrotolerans]